MTFDERKAAFAFELKALLKKYDVEIDLEDTGSGYYVDHDIVFDFNSVYTRDVEGKIIDLEDVGGQAKYGNFIDKDLEERK